MKLNNLIITFIDTLTIRDFQTINRLNEKYKKAEIDETILSNEMMKLIIKDINGNADKQFIEDSILWMTSLTDYQLLNEEIAKRINSFVNPLKKKK